MHKETYQVKRGLRVVRGGGSTLRPPDDRPLAQLAAEYGEAEVEIARQAGQVGYLGRVLVSATLPHSRPKEATWERTNGRLTLTLMAPPSIGLPYGVIPRLVLVWLTMEAKRTGERDVRLGKTLTEFLGRLELGRRGGERGDIGRLRGQVERLFSTTMLVRWDESEAGRRGGGGLMVADEWVLFWDPRRPEQGTLWESKVRLSEKFFREVVDHAVPIDLAILRALRRSPLMIDLYNWLTYRLPLVEQATTVPWEALAAQFGCEYKLLRQFRAKFLAALPLVLRQYPDARVEPTQAGLVLRPSRPSVPRLMRG